MKIRIILNLIQPEKNDKAILNYIVNIKYNAFLIKLTLTLTIIHAIIFVSKGILY